jgi:hypothetical protein
MNNARESTPTNPSPDLPIHSKDSHKTLGIVGTPQGTPYPIFGPPKLAKTRGIEEIPLRKPLTLERKPQNRAPLLTDLGGEINRKEI